MSIYGDALLRNNKISEGVKMWEKLYAIDPVPFADSSSEGWYEKGFKDFKDLDWENEVDRFHLNNDDLQQDLISTAKAQFA